MKTCIAIAIRFEETLIVQEHSTLKYGTFLGLKKRGNCTQLLEKTFREGKGPNHFSFFFSPCLFFPDLSRQNFPSILSIKNHSNQPMILDILENPRCSFSTNRYIIASTVSSLSSLAHRRVFTTSRQFFSLLKRILRFHSHSWLRVRRRDAKCVLSFNRPHPFLLSPIRKRELSLSLCPFYTERALLEFTYPTIETNRVIYTFAAIWAHTAERRAEIEDGKRRARAWPLWRYKPQTRQTNSRPRNGGRMDLWTFQLQYCPLLSSFLFLFFFFHSRMTAV